MPAILANADNFLFNTDYKLDKVVYLDSRSFTMSAFGNSNTTIAHGLSFTPLVNAVWSTSSDFSVVYGLGGGPRTGATRDYPVAVDADATNVYIAGNNNTGSSVTIYIRVYGFMPSDVNADVANLSPGDSLALSTDYNYTKLIDADVITGPSSGGRTDTITHGLGYRPQAAVWLKRGSTTAPFITNILTPGVSAFDQVVVAVDTTSLTINFAAVAGTYTLHYRLYGDQT